MKTVRQYLECIKMNGKLRGGEEVTFIVEFKAKVGRSGYERNTFYHQTPIRSVNEWLSFETSEFLDYVVTNEDVKPLVKSWSESGVHCAVVTNEYDDIYGRRQVEPKNQVIFGV
jgi:hypothetical protein